MSESLSMITNGVPSAAVPVLIVDDDTDAAEALQEYLVTLGYSSLLAHDLQQADATLTATDTAVVLLDVRLGLEFGLDLIPRVRAAHPHVQFIVMTAFADTDVAIEAVKRGAHDFLRKPLQPVQLVAALERSGELVRARQDREAALRELERSEANMRMAEAVGQFGSWSLDLRTGEGYWSEQHRRLFGVPTDMFVPTRDTFVACIHLEDWDAVFAAFAELETALNPVTVEYRIVRPDGAVRTMHSVATVGRDAAGKPLRWFGMVQDITERKQAEQELLRSQARLRQALDIAQLGTFEWHRAARTVHLSPETCGILGIAADAAQGAVGDEALLTDRVHSQDLGRLQQEIRGALERGGHYGIEIRVLRPDGQERTVESQGQVIRGEKGDPTSILGLVRDVTDIRLLEQQVRQAQKMDAVGSLAGGMAHDLNNTLQVVRGYIELEMHERGADRGPAESLDKALKATDSAARLIHQVLAFARSQVMQKQAVDLNDLVAQQVLMLRRIIRQDVDISIVPAAGPAVVEADKGMLEHVIVNLCLNARDAMPEGGALGITLNHWEAADAFCQVHGWARRTTYVVVTVRDSGLGMTPEVRQRIFEPFFTTKGPGKGTGLGLAMVYGIMQQHDGMVIVTSEPDSGSTFTLFLPASDRSIVAQADAPKASVARGSETILVAEDEAAVRELVVSVLTEHGYRALVASDGEEALRVFQEHIHAIDLALLDVVMPKLSGPVVYERLIAQRPDLPVIFSTGYAAESGDRTLLTRSGVPILRKPYAPAELLRVLRKALDDRP